MCPDDKAPSPSSTLSRQREAVSPGLAAPARAPPPTPKAPWPLLPARGRPASPELGLQATRRLWETPVQAKDKELAESVILNVSGKEKHDPLTYTPLNVGNEGACVPMTDGSGQSAKPEPLFPHRHGENGSSTCSFRPRSSFLSSRSQGSPPGGWPRAGQAHRPPLQAGPPLGHGERGRGSPGLAFP